MPWVVEMTVLEASPFVHPSFCNSIQLLLLENECYHDNIDDVNISSGCWEREVRALYICDGEGQSIGHFCVTST
jgi:hypothetical protein